MLRIILIILLALVAYRLLKNLFRSRSEGSGRITSSNGSSGSPQEMVSCNRCGTFIVKSNAIFNGSNYYCSEGCWKGH
jgi:hypothetical protein